MKKIIKKELLSAKNDFIFKLIFGDYRNIDILADFLMAVLELPKDEFERIEITDPHLKKEWQKDKLGILDVKLHTKSRYIIDIEIQVGETNLPRERVVFYNSKMITSQIGEGDDYRKVKRAISIIITDFEFIKENKSYHNRYFLYDKKTDSQFTDLIEINTLELSKLPIQSDRSMLWGWMKFLKSSKEEELSMLAKENLMIKKAVGMLKELSEDERTRLIYEEREKARMDYQTGMGISFDEGKTEGGIETLISDNLEENIPKERILQKLQKRFSLSEEDAKKVFERVQNQQG